MRFLDLKAINEIHVEISSRCLLNCKHCSSYNILHENGESFSLDNLEDFLKLFSKNAHVYITGGEPLLSDRIQDVLAICKECGLSLGLFTTFNVNKPLKELMYGLKKQGVADFYTSLYSAESAAHDEITRVKGSWDITVKSIYYAREVGISPKINFVLMRYNIENILESIFKLDKFGVDEIRVLKLVNHGEATRNWESLGVSALEQYSAVRQILFHRKEFKTRLTFSGFPLLEPCRPFESTYDCGAGKTLLYIDHSGDIYPCASMKNNRNFILGNIKNSSELQNKPLLKSKCLEDD